MATTNFTIYSPVQKISVATFIALTVSGIIVTFTGLMSGGRSRRNARATNATHENFLHQTLFKVLRDLDDSGCIALALCHANSLLPEYRTTDHNKVIETLSPEPGLPVPWEDLHTPAAKYQYASFIGLWARLTTNRDQCHHVFPLCPLSPADIVKVLTSEHEACGYAFQNFVH